MSHQFTQEEIKKQKGILLFHMFSPFVFLVQKVSVVVVRKNDCVIVARSIEYTLVGVPTIKLILSVSQRCVSYKALRFQIVEYFRVNSWTSFVPFAASVRRQNGFYLVVSALAKIVNSRFDSLARKTLSVHGLFTVSLNECIY